MYRISPLGDTLALWSTAKGEQKDGAHSWRASQQAPYRLALKLGNESLSHKVWVLSEGCFCAAWCT